MPLEPYYRKPIKIIKILCTPVTFGAEAVVFLLNPRYDSGRTHPYHPNRARFIFPVVLSTAGQLRIPR